MPTQYTFATVNGSLVAWPWRDNGTLAPVVVVPQTLTADELAQVRAEAQRQGLLAKPLPPAKDPV
jgi:hypothetical protein